MAFFFNQTIRNKNNIQVIKNLIYSFFSFSFPTVVLQFVIQPIIANKLGAELNGQYLTLMSLNYFLIGITASVLNTVRLLQDSKYREAGYKGDFNIFFLSYAVFLLVVMPCCFVLYLGFTDFIDIVLYVIIGLLYLYHDYIFSQYRIELRYNKILINNLILVLGYLIGIILFYIIKKWQIIIIIAYFLGGVYDFFNTSFIREPLKKTIFFFDTAKKITFLSISNLLSVAVTYCDKLILYPLLGGACVSIYTTASLVGKILVLISFPLNSVLLSYLIRMDTISIKISKKTLVIGILGVFSAYFVCLCIGYPLISFLYPDWAESSQIYMPITVASSAFVLIGNFLNTVIIRFYKISFQITIQGISLLVYLLFSLIFLHFWSLLGFCYGVALAGLVKLLILIFILNSFLKRGT